MHPLKLTLAVAAALALVVASIVGYAISMAGRPGNQVSTVGAEALFGAAVGFLVFFAPFAAMYFWAWRTASENDALTDRVHRLMTDSDTLSVGGSPFHDEVEDLARAIEQMRLHFVQDRDDQLRRQAALEEMVGGLREGLLAIDRDRQVVFANRSVADLFDIPPILPGSKLIENIRNRAVNDGVERALTGERFASRFTFRSGQRDRTIEVRVFPLSAGLDTKAVALFIDMTELARLERMRRDFLDDFSHEVRTPLAGLRSAIETFSREGLSPEDELQLRRILERQMTRLETLVHDLSELKTIESGDLLLEKRPVDLLPLLRDLADEYRDQSQTRRMSIKVIGTPAIAVVDSSRIQQVFGNLIDNAFRHSGKGETIVVEVRDEPNAAVVRVVDQGVGIPASEQTRIFHRFYRIDKSRSRDVPGSGLGLAITKHLVLLHGGTIAVESEPGKGATFEVRLPKDRNLRSTNVTAVA